MEERRNRRGSRSKNKKSGADKVTDDKREMRLNRFIAHSGICSRREADELITRGLITVNGKVVTDLGTKVAPGDDVRYGRKKLSAEKRYIFC